jgi:hypothetical protein
MCGELAASGNADECGGSRNNIGIYVIVSISKARLSKSSSSQRFEGKDLAEDEVGHPRRCVFDVQSKIHLHLDEPGLLLTLPT